MFLGSTGLFSKDKVSWALPQNLTEIKTQIPNFVGMNFLAHIYLSGTDEELTLGNFVDILYDHFLAVHWKEYSVVPLEIYIEDFYDLLQRNYTILPKPVQQFMPYMIRDNWLLSYATIEGIGRILYQMNERTNRKSRMNFAVVELEKHYPEFEEEFLSFFDELQLFAAKKTQALE